MAAGDMAVSGGGTDAGRWAVVLDGLDGMIGRR